MNRILRQGLTAVLALLGAAGPAWSQARSAIEQEDNIPYGTTSGEFLLLPVGGRATALGSAFTALANDISSLYWNPAGLSLMQDREVMLSHIDYIADTRYTWFGVATPMGAERALGASVGVFGFDDQPEYTVDQPEGTGRTYSVTLSVMALTLSQQFNERFSFGVTGKYINENLAGVTASTLAADIGTNYHTMLGDRPIRGSFVITNLGGTLRHRGSKLQSEIPVQDPSLPPGIRQMELQTKDWGLPATFKVGVAYDLISNGSSRLTTAGEFWQPRSNDVSGALGAEYGLTRIAGSGFDFALRGGFNYEPDNGLDVSGSQFNGMQSDGLSFGFGIGYHLGERGGAVVDYAFRDKGLLGDQHLLSFSLRW
ncbi:MAG: PorV/PorQ family protein [Gemmatimonadetes bacterium]|nr:PorV/PorQ family protein [Gemmatimonadota bacterium]